MLWVRYQVRMWGLFVINIKDEFIKAIMQSLKIDNNPFIYGTIDGFIDNIEPKQYKYFMAELFGTQHSYLNGLDRISKVSDQFNKKDEKCNGVEEEAKRLISLVYAINQQVFKDSQKYRTQFTDLMNVIILEQMIDSRDLSVLNQVKPHYCAKLLISGISSYQDSNVQLQAFVNALKFVPSDSVQIGNPLSRLKIKR